MDAGLEAGDFLDLDFGFRVLLGGLLVKWVGILSKEIGVEGGGLGALLKVDMEGGGTGMLEEGSGAGSADGIILAASASDGKSKRVSSLSSRQEFANAQSSKALVGDKQGSSLKKSFSSSKSSSPS